MTTFTDGPAKGEVLALRRAPLLLRVVQSAVKGEWDALDQLADTPTPREKVHVYRRVGKAQWVFWRPGGRFAWASYSYEPVQPPADVTRDTAAWQAWATERAAVRATA
jgi:hypothetical protein